VEYTVFYILIMYISYGFALNIYISFWQI